MSALHSFLRFLCLFAASAASLWFSGCASASKTPPQPYLRIAYPDDDTVELQIAARKFVPARGHGPAIWLVGASHIGESNYYAGLQRELDGHTLVLYEGVGEHARRTRPPRIQPRPDTPSLPSPSGKPAIRPQDEDVGLQGTMARSLGLVFQLEAMNYDRTNFLNSDLTIAEIQALMQPGGTRIRPKERESSQPKTGAPARKAAASADDEGNTAFQDLLKAMDGSSTFGAVMQGLMKFIGSSAKLQAMTKLTLIEVLGAIKADPTRLQGMPPDMKKLLEVLIHERNKVVIEDLKAELKRARPEGSIGVFYGAGHLPDMEQRLRRELRYRPESDTWHAAFSVNTTRAGLSSFELTFLRGIIRSQIGPLTQ